MPRDAWTNKEERMYDKIKRQKRSDGTSMSRAKEIAARTVNKHRREQGHTDNAKTQGTGNPNKGLEDRTKDELYNRAKELNIRGRSSMRKSELVKAIRSAN